MSRNQESNSPILRPSIIQFLLASFPGAEEEAGNEAKFLHTVNYQTLDCGKAREARVGKTNDIFLSVLL